MQDHFVVATVTFKVAVITSSVTKLTFVVAEISLITFSVAKLTFVVTKIILRKIQILIAAALSIHIGLPSFEGFINLSLSSRD